MTDDGQVLRGIDWREAFPFTHIFRAFRIAVHPSKLVLALATLLILYFAGGLLDWVWPGGSRAVYINGQAEVAAYGDSGRDTRVDFAERRQEGRDAVVERYATLLLNLHEVNDRNAALDAARSGKKLGEVKWWIEHQRDEEVARIRKDRETNLAIADKLMGPDKDRIKRAYEATYRSEMGNAYAQAMRNWDEAQQIKGSGIFHDFFAYEIGEINATTFAVLSWTWLGSTGVIAHVINFFTVGPTWMLTQHCVFFFIYLIIFLLVWAVFGGAISRIAAVHVAREEKISVRQAMQFAVSKVLSFVFAPVIPLGMVVAIGLLVTLVSLIGNFTWIGPIVVGLLFFLALIAGLVMTLILLGLIGGFNMMYPTISVEGSDSFDAISRSFSYLYARPWRVGFYTAVSIVYGALTYLFIRFFLLLMLTLVHNFVGLGTFRNAPNEQPQWSTMWPAPQWEGHGSPAPGTASGLTYDIDLLTLNSGQSIGAGLVAFWVYLTVGLLGAYAISYYFSVNTIIYYLLRREVDATELDDVYIEQTDEEFTESSTGIGAAPAAGEAVVVSTVSATIVEAPPTSPSAESPTTEPESPPPTT